MRFTVLFFIFFALAGCLYGGWVKLSNRYVIISEDYDSARLTMDEAISGTNTNLFNYRPILYPYLPLTSFMTISYNGQYSIYGSESGFFKQKPFISGENIISEWVLQDLTVIQSAGIVAGISSGAPDTMKLTFSYIYSGTQEATVETRVVLDTFLGSSEPKMYSIAGTGDISRETLLYKDSIPAYWYSCDNYNNPVVRAQETIENSTLPVRIIFASWERFNENRWDFNIDSSRDFRRLGTPQYDSAVGIFYSPLKLSRGVTNSITLLYGVYGPFSRSKASVSESSAMPVSNTVEPVAPAAIKTPEVQVSTVVITNVITNTQLNSMTNVVTNYINAVTNTTHTVSSSEAKLLNEIGSLDGIIDKVSIKYEILMGIFKNTFITNSTFLKDIDSDIKHFEEKLSDEEESLSNDMIPSGE